MGIFKKIKDIFYDEEIVEVPVKEVEKEERVVEKPISVEAPKIEPINPTPTVREPSKSVNAYSERELFKPEKTFDFPVFNEEDEAPIMQKRSRTNILEIQKELEKNAYSRQDSSHNNRVHEKVLPKETKASTFKPSPVISPIYGILDKNYKKEEIIEKKESYKIEQKDVDYEYVRKKAYGSLEDELENTLTRVNSEISDSVDEIEKELDNLPKPSRNIEDLLSEIDKNKTTSIGDLEEAAKNRMLEEEEREETGEIKLDIDKDKEEKTAEVSDNTLEHDLFNLIDSMYEDKEE